MSPHRNASDVSVRNTRPEDIDQVIGLCRRVYSDTTPWTRTQLESHLKHFPEGQFVAVDERTGRVVGMAATLCIAWDDYDLTDNWRDFTDHGWFTNHDPAGTTLYAAEVMVDPQMQGRGIGKKLYRARRELCRRLGKKRIRAGARLRGYHLFADQMSPEQYVQEVIAGEIGDPTLSFQLKRGFRVIGVVRDYLQHDPSSKGHAAVIEWLNHQVAQRRDYRARDPQFAKRRKRRESSSAARER